MDTEQELNDILDDMLEDFECEEINSLKEDYNSFYKWTFGDFNAYKNKDEAIEKWKILHPDLPLPRILKSDKNINAYLNSVCLVMDVYPLYLQYRSKK